MTRQLFDSAGKVRFQEESSSSTGREAYTMCSLFFAPFEVRCSRYRYEIVRQQEQQPLGGGIIVCPPPPPPPAQFAGIDRSVYSASLGFACLLVDLL